MKKTEILEICDLSDLRKYEQSSEYKKILEDCERKAKIIQDEVLDCYREEKIDRETEYDFHDKQFAYLEFLKIMLTKIKSSSKWAKALRKEIENEIKYAEIGIGTRAMNEFGHPYSWNKLTLMDMKRVAGGHYRTFYTILNGLIFSVDEEMQKAAADEVREAQGIY